jgi:hypothetical protein
VQPIFMTLSEVEQLRVGNRLMEDLCKLARPDNPALGVKSVTGVIESGRSIAALGLADITQLLESQLKRPIASLSDLMPPQTNRLSNTHQ